MLYPTRNILRLCLRLTFQQNKRNNFAAASNGPETRENVENNSKTKDFQTLFAKHKDKITWNSHLESEKLHTGYFKYYQKTIDAARKKQAREYYEKSLPPLPVALRYLVDQERLLKEEEEEPPTPEKAFQLPFASTTPIEDADTDDKPPEKPQKPPTAVEQTEFDRSRLNQWMTNYEQFDDTKLEEDEDEATVDYELSKQYGTADPSSGVTGVPCGGCGALLHCSDPAIPGYLPSEILKNCSLEEQSSVECQRCHFLKEYNIALDVNVQPEEYEKLLQSIRHVRSLVILMVDLLDYPCSIWPGIVDIIGTKRPIIVVGNKVDLLPGDSIGYLKRVRQSLLSELKKTKLGEANIKHVALISAKTGYGVESLVSAMFQLWLARGDVHLVGCTNVGKSSLFNALLQSDYCKVQAAALVRRATVSRWPGTTLNLLKFPINRPSGWKIHERTRRLRADSKLMKIENQIRREQVEGTSTPELPTLMGHIGRTFSDPRDFNEDYNTQEKRKRLGFNERDEMFAKSKWLFDTPGVIHPDQVLSLLTTEELLVTIPKKLIRPQTYYLFPGSTLFIGGLARIDFLECEEPCRFTIYCSDALPITVTKTEDADEMYEEFVGTELFGAPIGGAERLASWPGLQRLAEVLEFSGEGPKTCCGDVVLSSIGWVSVTAKQGSTCKVLAWTPQARGIHYRHPSLLPYAINLKGKRIRDTPAYMLGKVFIDDNYVTSSDSGK
ncbi:unnamed protein product [Plutella xylostella]|uniref:(diamondback moth) hypothetical protein n=1 Tax=Plutella xylostella TaxID=51655 RepID=A0A8S4G1G7_PLUXY|nr:unnamed protein product [Plutella xylostella]